MLEYRLLHVPKCDRCHQPFDEAARCPRIFKACGHTACQSCLEAFVATVDSTAASSLTCLFCPETFSLPSLSVSEFPKHFVILDSIQLIHEESPCSHGDQTPQDFICLDSTCINKGGFCGMCYYTVHSKCDRRQVIRRRDFDQLVYMDSFAGCQDTFLDHSLANLEGSSLSPDLKTVFGRLAHRLGEVLSRLSSGKERLACDDFLRARDNYFIDSKKQPGFFVLQPKATTLIQHFIEEFPEALRTGAEAATPDLVLLRGMRNLLLFTTRDPEDRFLATLLDQHLPQLTSIAFRFDDGLLCKDDIVKESFRAFRGAFEASHFQEQLTHEVKVLRNVLTKIEKEISDVEKLVATVTSTLQDLKSKRERLFRNTCNQIKERVFLKRTHLDMILLKYEGAMEEQARANFQAPESWDISHEDYQVWMEKVNGLPKLEPTEGEESPLDLTTLFSADTELRLTQEERENVRTGLNCFNSFNDSIAITETLCGIHKCSLPISWGTLLARIATVNPETATFLKSRLNPTFVYLKAEVSPFLESTGVLSRHNEDKTVWDFFNSEIKIMELDAGNFKALRTMCAEQKVEGASHVKELEKRKMFSAELKTEQTRLKNKIAERSKLERCINKAFTERNKVLKVPVQELPASTVAPQPLVAGTPETAPTLPAPQDAPQGVERPVDFVN